MEIRGDINYTTTQPNTELTVFVEMEEEWVAQVEPGILITFISLPGSGNLLKRMRFSRERFNKWQAKRWWVDNYEMVMELYNVQMLNQQAAPLSPTPPRSDDENSKIESGGMVSTPKLSSIIGVKTKTETSSSSSREELGGLSTSISNIVSEQETEWVEQDEPGVYITIRSIPGVIRELRRIRFSREKFEEMHARLWWEENRARVHTQYL